MILIDLYFIPRTRVLGVGCWARRAGWARGAQWAGVLGVVMHEQSSASVVMYRMKSSVSFVMYRMRTESSASVV